MPQFLTDSVVELRYQIFQVFYEGLSSREPASEISDHDNFEACRLPHPDDRSQDIWDLS